MNKTEFEQRLAPLLKEIGDINRKYNYNRDNRSEEDKERWAILWYEVHKIENEFDRLNPISDCPECGGVRMASWGGYCINFARCSLAPPGAGG